MESQECLKPHPPGRSHPPAGDSDQALRGVAKRTGQTAARGMQFDGMVFKEAGVLKTEEE